MILVIGMANHPPQLISHRQPPPPAQQGKTFIRPLHQYLGCYTCHAINNFISVWTELHFSGSILYFWVWICSSVFGFYISFLSHIFTPVCSNRPSRAIHQTFFSCLAGAQFADHITYLAPVILLQFEHTLSQLTCFTHTYIYSLVWICLKIFCFFLCFMWPIC